MEYIVTISVFKGKVWDRNTAQSRTSYLPIATCCSCFCSKVTDCYFDTLRNEDRYSRLYIQLYIQHSKECFLVNQIDFKSQTIQAPVCKILILKQVVLYMLKTFIWFPVCCNDAVPIQVFPNRIVRLSANIHHFMKSISWIFPLTLSYQKLIC